MSAFFVIVCIYHIYLYPSLMATNPTDENSYASPATANITLINPSKWNSNGSNMGLISRFEDAGADRDRKFLESDNRAHRNTHFLHDNITEQALAQERRAQHQTSDILRSEEHGFDKTITAVDKTDRDVIKEGSKVQERVISDNNRNFLEADNRAQRTAYNLQGHIRQSDNNDEVRGRENTKHILGDMRSETRNLNDAINRNGQENIVSTERNGAANALATEKIGAGAVQATQRVANELQSTVERNGQSNLVANERTGLANTIAIEKTAANGIYTTQRVATENLQAQERIKTDLKGDIHEGFGNAITDLNTHSMETMREYATVKSGLEKIKHKDSKNSHEQYEKLHRDLDRVHDKFEFHGLEHHRRMDRLDDRFEHRDHEHRESLNGLGDRLNDTYRELHRDSDHLNNRFSDRFTTVDKDALHIERRTHEYATEFALRNERMLDGVKLQAATNTAKLNKQMLKVELQAANNTAAIQLEATRNAGNMATKMAECCCEIKSTVVREADSIKGVLSTSENMRLRDELYEARARNLAHESEHHH